MSSEEDLSTSRSERIGRDRLVELLDDLDPQGARRGVPGGPRLHELLASLFLRGEVCLTMKEGRPAWFTEDSSKFKSLTEIVDH